MNCIDVIKRYCYDCANGLRTVGCCCHVVAIIYFLSFARYETEIIRPAELLTHIFDPQEVNEVVPIVSDSKDSGDSDNGEE